MNPLKSNLGGNREARLTAEFPGLSVEGCCFVPGKEAIAVGSTGGEIHLIDITQGVVVRTTRGEVADPGWIAVSRSGAHLAVLDRKRGGGGGRERVEIWDVDAGTIVLAAELENRSESVALSPDASKLAVGRSYDPVIDFMFEFVSRHVGVFPTILGDNAYVCFRGLIDNGINSLKITIVTKSNHYLKFRTQNSGS